MVGLQKNN